MAIMKKAKELRIASVQNCQSCHTDKMPKKGAAAVNEMGTWLVDQKKVRKAKEEGAMADPPRRLKWIGPTEFAWGRMEPSISAIPTITACGG